MDFLIGHLPHLIPAIVALGFLAKFGMTMELEPDDLDDESLEEWRRRRDERALARRVRRSTARLGLIALVPLVVAVGTGGWLYTLALDDRRPSQADAWIHGVVSVLALVLVGWKLADLGWARLRRGLDPRRAFSEGVSLLLAVLGLPLLVTGAVLLWTPSSGSYAAYTHLVVGVWWTVLLTAHLSRYLGRSLTAGRSGEPDAPQPQFLPEPQTFFTPHGDRQS
jgi:hypothetical protein